MRTTRIRQLAAVIVAGLLVLGACGDDDSSDPAAEPADELTDDISETDPTDTDPADTDPGDTDPGSDFGGGGDGNATLSISLIEDGEEVTHKATASEAGCSRNGTGEGSFGVQYTADNQEGFHSFQMQIDNVEAATTSAAHYSATARVDENHYHVPFGSGTMMTLDDQGDAAKITMVATSEEGVYMTVIVDCHMVFDL